jgi:hypothetical protein
MEGEDIIEVEYCMSKLVDKALGQRIELASLDLTAETARGDHWAKIVEQRAKK